MAGVVASSRAQRLSASKIGSPCRTLGSLALADRCSTPVGVKDRFTLVAAQPAGRGLGVLNACRRQRSVHVRRAVIISRQFECSTPVGVKDRFTGERVGGAPWDAKCSTPVGVKDRFTGCRLRAGGHRGCAQRLSASKIGSPVRLFNQRTRLRRAQRLSASKIGSHSSISAPDWHGTACSTPVGVKDRFTGHSGRRARVAASAQRLSASKIGSPADRALPWHRNNCAQRLSASKIGSP